MAAYETAKALREVRDTLRPGSKEWVLAEAEYQVAMRAYNDVGKPR